MNLFWYRSIPPHNRVGFAAQHHILTPREDRIKAEITWVSVEIMVPLQVASNNFY